MTGRDPITDHLLEQRSIPRRIRLIMAGAVALMLVGGWGLYEFNRARLIRLSERELNAATMAQLQGIERWLAERKSDALMVARLPGFRRYASRLVRGDDQTAREHVNEALEAIRRRRGYVDVMLVDQLGRVVFSLSGQRELPEEFSLVLDRWRDFRNPRILDFSMPSSPSTLFVGVVTSLMDERGDVPLAALVFLVDPSTILGDQGQWCRAGVKMHVILARPDGERLYLTRYHHGWADTTSHPIAMIAQGHPLAKALRREAGIVHGVDLEGGRVLAAVAPVPGTPWSVISQIDLSDTMEAGRGYTTILAALFTVFLGLIGAVGLVVWQREEKLYFRRLYQVESERRSDEERYGITLQSISDGVITTDSRGRVELLNPVAEELTGWSTDEARGKELHEIFTIFGEESRLPTMNPLQRLWLSGQILGDQRESMLVSKDGREYPVAYSGAPIRDREGRITGVVIVFRDQTREREAHRALLNEQRRTRLYLEVARVMLLALDSDGRVVLVNRRGAELLGLPEEEIIGKSWFEHFIPLEERARLEAVFADLMRGEVKLVEYVENHVLTARGERRLIAWHNSILTDDDGRIVGTFSSGEDISERKQAELERERLISAMEQTEDEVLITDTDWRILYVNPAFERHTGFTKEEVLGGFPELYYDERQTDEFYQKIADTLLSGKTWKGRLVSLKKDGSTYICDTTVSPVRGNSQEIVNFVAVKHDVSRELDLEEQYRQAQKMETVGRLAGGVAHDFNNILTVIQGSCELLLMEAEGKGTIAEIAEEIRSAAEKAASLTRQLLTFARKQTVKPRVLDLNSVIEGMLRMLRRLVGENIVLEWRPGLDVWPVKMDPTQIDQIMANLVVNAMDAIDGNGTITIQTGNRVLDEAFCESHHGARPGPYVYLSVSDDGCGMDQETMARIFEPFFTTKKVGSGTGLGLATVYGIVKQNHGYIYVDSRPGGGTRFEIFLPRCELPAMEDEGEGEGATRTPRGDGETILVVEDDEAILGMISKMLSGLGYRVLSESDPGKALETFERFAGDIQLVLSDLVMPGMNGKEMVARMREIGPEPRVLFMSGYTADIITNQGVLERGVKFLSKPFTAQELSTMVYQVIHGVS